MRSIAGDTREDERLWNSYLYWARSELTRSSHGLDIGEARNRLPGRTSEALRAVVFAAFTLEYRLKRTLLYVGQSPRTGDTLGRLLSNIDVRLAQATCPDGRRIVLPREWTRVKKNLRKLVELRNEIAHADWTKLSRRLATTRYKRREAKRLYNAVIDAIRILNHAVGYDPRQGVLHGQSMDVFGYQFEGFLNTGTNPHVGQRHTFHSLSGAPHRS